MTGLTIVPAGLDDVPSIAEVHVRSWQAAYADILPAEYLRNLSVEARAQRWREALARRESTTLLARHADEVVGFVSHGACRDKGAPPTQGEIWALYAAPSVWGRGTGRALLQRAVLDLRGQGFASVSLWVLTRNERGQRFYASCGFQRVDGSEQTFELGGVDVQETAYRRLIGP